MARSSAGSIVIVSGSLESVSSRCARPFSLTPEGISAMAIDWSTITRRGNSGVKKCVSEKRREGDDGEIKLRGESKHS